MFRDSFLRIIIIHIISCFQWMRPRSWNNVSAKREEKPRLDRFLWDLWFPFFLVFPLIPTLSTISSIIASWFTIILLSCSFSFFHPFIVQNSSSSLLWIEMPAFIPGLNVEVWIFYKKNSFLWFFRFACFSTQLSFCFTRLPMALQIQVTLVQMPKWSQRRLAFSPRSRNSSLIPLYVRSAHCMPLIRSIHD